MAYRTDTTSSEADDLLNRHKKLNRGEGGKFRSKKSDEYKKDRRDLIVDTANALYEGGVAEFLDNQ